MNEFTDQYVLGVEHNIQDDISQDELIRHLKPIGLTAFSLLMLSMPDEKLPKISKILPTMASEDVQKSWTGCSGTVLLAQSLDFVRTVITGIAELRQMSVDEFSVLDFGCGYGRLARLFYYYIKQDNFYGVDPWDRSINECLDNGIAKNIFLSDYLPSSLPLGDKKFDLIYAFSVFTHLSERATKLALNTLGEYLNDDGILVVTIRPVEYWELRKDLNNRDALVDAHRTEGFAFRPHNRASVDGDITYGDTSMTVDWLLKNFPQYRISKIDYSLSDRHQLYIFLTKSSE